MNVRCTPTPATLPPVAGTQPIVVRRAADCGHADHGWLDTWHTFSFSSYHDPEHVQFRSPRVMNEDFVAPGRGFGTPAPRHGNRDLRPRRGPGAPGDSMGNGEVLRPGEFQRMSAGTGITHSEFNPSKTEPVHLHQIWLLPERRGSPPATSRSGSRKKRRQNRLRLVASRDAADGSLSSSTRTPGSSSAPSMPVFR